MSNYIILTKEQFYEKAKKLFGNDPKDWIFECGFCNNEQSFSSIMNKLEKDGYIESKRYGVITKDNISKLKPKPDQECISKDCNFVSYGLINGSLEVDGHNYLMLKGLRNDIEVNGI